MPFFCTWRFVTFGHLLTSNCCWWLGRSFLIYRKPLDKQTHLSLSGRPTPGSFCSILIFDMKIKRWICEEDEEGEVFILLRSVLWFGGNNWGGSHACMKWVTRCFWPHFCKPPANAQTPETVWHAHHWHRNEDVCIGIYQQQQLKGAGLCTTFTCLTWQSPVQVSGLAA